jgi:hypothetical protein
MFTGEELNGMRPFPNAKFSNEFSNMKTYTKMYYEYITG